MAGTVVSPMVERARTAPDPGGNERPSALIGGKSERVQRSPPARHLKATGVCSEALGNVQHIEWPAASRLPRGVRRRGIGRPTRPRAGPDVATELAANQSEGQPP